MYRAPANLPEFRTFYDIHGAQIYGIPGMMRQFFPQKTPSDRFELDYRNVPGYNKE
ncbi:MAG: hypothetical protein GTO29_14895 [Candidatus Latescibacteria bacterium]|nr:hypothetical protein [Candidatus Latescibacterota bacterium]NIO57438.1 hypothetical protein [Candidatus Latescibacterota bacterium]